jgi:hypothetical protein
MRLRSASWLALSSLVALPAAGVVTVYDTQGDFLATIAAGSYLETFDATPVGSTSAPLAYSGNGLSYDVKVLAPAVNPHLYPFTIPGGDPSDVIMGLANAEDTLIFDFTSGNVAAVGAFFFSTDIDGGVITADAIVDTDLTDPMVVSTAGTTTTFLGFISDQPFAFLSVRGDNASVVAFPSVNDVIVPEPSHAALLLAGALVLLAARVLRSGRSASPRAPWSRGGRARPGPAAAAVSPG